MNPVQTEIETPEQTKLAVLSRPYSANGKVYHFDMRHVTGYIITHERLEFRYVVEYMPRLKCHRAKRMVKAERSEMYGSQLSQYITMTQRWNKHVDVPSMSEAMSALEDMITEEVAKWK